jgi:PEGA domain
MNYSRLTVICLATAVCLTAFTSEARAQRRGGHSRGGHAGGGRVVGRAVPRPFIGGRTVVVAPRRYITPHVFGVVPYRPYYYGYRPGLTVGFYAGVGYPYGYPYRYGYPSRYGYPYPGYASAYPYSGYGYSLPPPGYVSALPGYAYGGVRIQDAPPDAQVFVDGYYMGVVDDFDGPFQHLNLTAGPHQIEIRAAGYRPIAFDVNVQPGRTITYRASIQ